MRTQGCVLITRCARVARSSNVKCARAKTFSHGAVAEVVMVMVLMGVCDSEHLPCCGCHQYASIIISVFVAKVLMTSTYLFFGCKARKHRVVMVVVVVVCVCLPHHTHSIIIVGMLSTLSRSFSYLHLAMLINFI